MTNTSGFIRDALEGVDKLFSERWSPRAFTAKHTIEKRTLAKIIDAARWSPSCFNEQPWVFYTSSDSTFDDYLALLVESNQQWAKNASVIGFLAGKKQFSRNGKPNDYSRFDCGAAWMGLTLQSRIEGLYTHGMGGFDRAAAEQYLHMDTGSEEVIMAFAIGKIGNKNTLPETLRGLEQPSGRKALDEIWVSKEVR